MKSLEDKAEEYADKLASRENRAEWNAPYYAYLEGYKQALKDMIDRAEELQLPYLRMYKKIAEGLGGK